MKKEKKATWSATFRLHLRAYRLVDRCCPGLFFSTTLKAIIFAIVPYVTVYLSARIIDELAGSRRPEVLWQWVIVTVAAEAVLGLLQWGVVRWNNVKWVSFDHNIGNIFVEKQLSMDYADLDRHETADLLSQIRQNQSWYGFGLPVAIYSFQPIITGFTGIAGAVALTAGLFLTPVPGETGALTALDHPAVILGLLVVIALFTAAAPMLSGKAESYLQNVAMSEKANFRNRVFTTFSDVGADQYRALDIRMYSQQKIALHYLGDDDTFSVGGTFDRLNKGLNGLLHIASNSMSTLLTGAVYVYVCLKAWAGAFGVGSVTQYVAAVTALAGNFKSFLSYLLAMRNNVPFLEKVFEYLDIPNAMYQGSLTTEKRSDRQYEVEFRDVSFKYPGSDNWALRHVSVKFKVGNRLAVVGENGSGKTTFIKLLCRLYDPQEGQILLNGIDIRKYNYRDYMDVFSVVFQDFQLLSQPLGNNVAGRADYDEARVLQSLADAGFGERLDTLPDGLGTQLYRDYNDEGVMISGGEAQKIAIARALYKDAPFIILDEPTAALDPIAEAEIYAQFNEISGDKTAIYISHRLSSCRFCDEILVFDDGQIVQQGSHDGLLGDEDGKYHQLWHAQAQYYEL